MAIENTSVSRGAPDGRGDDGPSVLVTDGMQKKSLSVVRAIAAFAGDVGVVSAYPVSMAGVSRHADRRHWITAADGDEYVRRLNEVIDGAGYDHVLPVGGRTFDLLSARRERLHAPIDSILPPRASMELAVDKGRVHDLAEDLSVPTPTTRRVSDRSDLTRLADGIGYPVVLKSGLETDTRFVRRADGPAELRSLYAEFRRRYDSVPLLQQHLPGDGRGYFGLYVDGERRGSYTHHRIREYPPSGGASACAESGRDPELRRYGSRILDALDWTGVAMVEFKDDAEGTPHVLEINPKFWGSLDLALRSGLNFPADLLAHADGADIDERRFTPSRVHWPLSGDLHHALSRPETAPSVLEDLLSPRTGSNVRVDDALPHVVEAGKALAGPVLDGGIRERLTSDSRSESGLIPSRNGQWNASAPSGVRSDRS